MKFKSKYTVEAYLLYIDGEHRAIDLAETVLLNEALMEKAAERTQKAIADITKGLKKYINPDKYLNIIMMHL
jgi:hypothetical protein